MTEYDHKRHFEGLTLEQVAESLRLYGANVLTPPAREPLWKRFLGKFRDPLIIILLVAGIFSVGISFYEYYGLDEGPGVFFEPIGIFIAILLAAGLSFLFEMKAEREFSVLNRVNDDEPVQVIRNGSPCRIQRRNVVKGDIVLLDTGQEIPADGRLLESVSLNVDESTLTGEPLCHKSADSADFDPEATFPTDVVLRGTKVMEGHGIMEVTAVGDATENGKVFVAAQIDSSVKTPLDEQLLRLGGLISRVAYCVAAAIVVGRVTMYFVNTPVFELVGFLTYLLQTLMIVVALIAVAVPEGLPMAVTLSLAYSMRRMLRTNNLVRRLHACETMGATTVICTDKTGTLTQNRMQVAETAFADNVQVDIIESGIAVNSTARLDLSGETPQVLGNPTEGALLLWLDSRGVDYQKLRDEAVIISELPFTTERKYMATMVAGRQGTVVVYIKGAPEIIYAMCDNTSGIDSVGFNDMQEKYQSRAMRTIGFARGEFPAGVAGNDIPSLIATGKGIDFLGVVAINDPVRPDVPDAVGAVVGAGIKVKIVTGDTSGTAREIGRRIGLWDDSSDTDANIITGAEFAMLDDDELKRRVGSIKIISRARPMDKKRLVETLQECGEVVAVTGDGTNDAPALKAAHVGLSMGDGTAVAKEASDITIVDNSFSSIGRAVMWGRSLYQNIQRFILFQMTVNVAACLVVLAGAFMGMQSPLTVTQMLWVNLIMDTFAAMALASLPPSSAVMRDMPRQRRAFIITGNMWRSIISTGIAFFLLLLALIIFFEHYDVVSLTSVPRAVAPHYMTPYELTVVFTVFVFLQFWNMFNARAFETGRSAFHLRGCRGFATIAIIIFIGQILIVCVGGRFFNVVALSVSDWLVIAGSTSVVLWVGELLRLFNLKR